MLHTLVLLPPGRSQHRLTAGLGKAGHTHGQQRPDSKGTSPLSLPVLCSHPAGLSRHSVSLGLLYNIRILFYLYCIFLFLFVLPFQYYFHY